MATDGYLDLTYSGNTIQIPHPIFPYKTIITPDIQWVELANGKWSGYDYGATYDKRVCDCVVNMTPGEWSTFSSWFDAYSRQNSIYIETTAASGLFLFGPDLTHSTALQATVNMDPPKEMGYGEDPYRYIKVGLRFTYAQAATQEVVSDVHEGHWSLGSVTGIRFPPEWWGVDNEYRWHTDPRRDRGANAYFIDRGSTADRYLTKSVTLVLRYPKANRLVREILNTIRDNTALLIAPSGHYVFGGDKGEAGSYNVRIPQRELQITHARHNEFHIPLSFSWDS